MPHLVPVTVRGTGWVMVSEKNRRSKGKASPGSEGAGEGQWDLRETTWPPQLTATPLPTRE